jgi:hypothetical protein
MGLELYPWQKVFMLVAARAFTGASLKYRSIQQTPPKPPTTIGELGKEAILGIRGAWETTIRDWLFQELTLSRDANGLYIGPEDKKRRSWVFRPELPYMGKDNAGDRVDIGLIRFVSHLKETTDRKPTFWCGVELKRARAGIRAIDRDIAKIRGRSAKSILETCNILVWGLSEDSSIRQALEARVGSGILIRAQWAWIPLGAKSGASRPAAVDDWVWVLFAQVADDPKKVAKKQRRDEKRLALFNKWRTTNSVDYYGGQWTP